MKRKLTDNIPLKIMSLAVAILVWLLVVNIDNPIVTKTIVVANVEIVNGAYIDDAGKMVMREEKQDSVRVTIRGERKTVSKLTAVDIHAVADLQQAVSLETDPVMVPITVTCDKISAENIEVNPRNLSLHMEDKLTQEFVVNVTTESKPGRGYEVGTKTSSPEKIKITGPTSLINKIDKVNAVVNVEDKTEDISEETELIIIDKNGEQLSETEMSYLNVPKVVVTIRLWKVRSNVDIHADYTGDPADGYEVESVTTIPDVVSVAGTEDALETLAQMNNTIWIPAENIDISGKSSDYEVKINITELLSEGLKLTSDSSEDVFVMVNILPVGSAVYDIPTRDIGVKNKADELQVAFDTDKIEIRVKETGEGQGDLTAGDITAYIDLEGKEEGSYEIPVEITLPDGYELLEAVTAEIRVSEITNTESNNE